MQSAADPSKTIRALVLGVVAFGLVGTSVELAFLEHYEEPSMFIPFAVNLLAVAAILLYALAATPGTVRILRLMMVVLVLTSLAGIVLHYRGSLEFQVDMDPTLSASQLFWKVMHMKAPPTLAPGVLAELGLLGFVATYGHPAVRRQERLEQSRTEN